MGAILKIGDKGVTVKDLQTLLNSLGSVVTAKRIDPLTVDGDFGNATLTALFQAQGVVGVDADGVFGPKTQTAIVTYLSRVTTVKPDPIIISPASPVKFPITTRAAATARYGAIANGTWPDESKWMEYVEIPEAIGALWLTNGNQTGRIYVNKDLAPLLLVALQNLQDHGCAKELKTFDGCLNIRNIRGSTSQSAHSYGIAIDINADTNPLGGPSSWSDAFVKCFTDAGFFWGGNFKGRTDPMHYCGLDW